MKVGNRFVKLISGKIRKHALEFSESKCGIIKELRSFGGLKCFRTDDEIIHSPNTSVRVGRIKGSVPCGYQAKHFPCRVSTGCKHLFLYKISNIQYVLDELGRLFENRSIDLLKDVLDLTVTTHHKSSIYVTYVAGLKGFRRIVNFKFSENFQIKLMIVHMNKFSLF